MLVENLHVDVRAAGRHRVVGAAVRQHAVGAAVRQHGRRPVAGGPSARALVVAALTLALVAGLPLAAAPAAAASPDVVVSQVYGGGGNTGATFTHDFVELFNRGGSAVSLSGWSVQYASATGATWLATPLQGTLQPGQRHLVQQAAGGGGTTALPTPDTVGSTSMSATSGKVVVVRTTTPIATGTSCPSGADVADLVGYGDTTCVEGGGAAPRLTNATAALRLGGGCTDTDHNRDDFVLSGPTPRNSASPLSPCTTPTDPAGTGAASPDPVVAGGTTLLTVAVTPGTNPASTGLTVTADLTPIGGAAAQALTDDGTGGDATAGDGTFSATVTVPPGTAAGPTPLSATIRDAQGRTGSTAIPLTVQATGPVGATVSISQVYGGGGNSGATFTHDFVELHNRSTAAVDLAGWSVQYASAAGTSWSVTPIAGVLQPGRHHLVQQAQGAGGTTPLPTPDSVGTTAMSATAGKVALVSTTAPLTGACPTGGGLVDLVGYGSTASCAEGSGPAPAPSNTTAAIRLGAGATDTDDNAADFTTGPPNPRNTSAGLDSAPAVASTSPADGATGVPLNTDVSITFSEPVTVTGSWASITCTARGAVASTTSGGPTTYVLDLDGDLAPGESCTVTVVGSQVADVDADDPPDTMDGDHVFAFTTAAADPCAGPTTPIPTIQGPGTASPLAGSTVTTEGVVVGDFQGPSGLNGFNLQDPVGDGDPETSDGIFVFVPAANPRSGIDVAVGDVVRVTGRVIEFNTLTEIDLVSEVAVCGTTTPPAPTPISLPETVDGDLERYEGMLVTVPQTLTVSQNFFQGRFGQVTLAAEGRLFTPTNLFAPGSPQAIAQADANARRVLVLDDGRTSQNPDPIPYIGVDDTLRAGDTVAGLTGVIDVGPITAASSPRDYRLQPTQTPTFTRVNDRTPAPAPVGGDVTVAAFNVLNYFNGDGVGGGFPTARGASTPAELDRQRAKIVAALTAIDADVVGLMEIENDPRPRSAVEDLVDALNAATAPGTYAFVDTGVIGTDQIRVALLYQPAVVAPVGPHAILTSAVDPDFDDTRNRPALAQTFEEVASGARVTVVVNHLKSKGSACPGDPDLGDGQGNCNQTRLRAANALTRWIAGDPTGSGDPDALIIGDLNAYAQEDPIRAITAAGYVNLIEDRLGASAYSFVFNGQAGYLDHALATDSLAPQVTGITEWHINADEPSVIDYNTEFKPQDLYTPTPYRSSDHDPVIVGLQLNAPPTVDAGGPWRVDEGGEVVLAAAGTDPEGRALTYAWDLDGDGTFESVGRSVTFSAVGLDGPTTRTVAVRAADPGGLEATATAVVDVANAAPVVAPPVTSPSPSSPGVAVTASASFTDPAPDDGPFACTVDPGDGSGPQAGTSDGATCTGPAHVYDAVGAYTVTVAVTDADGDTGTASATHRVLFAFDGFRAPLADPPATTRVNAGRAVPITFGLGGDQGTAIHAAGFPASQEVSCSTGDAIGSLEPITSPGSSGLSYDADTDTYTHVWKTDRAWAGTCRELVVRLVDSSEHRARLTLR